MSTEGIPEGEIALLTVDFHDLPCINLAVCLLYLRCGKSREL